jgi:hypothetical protein
MAMDDGLQPIQPYAPRIDFKKGVAPRHSCIHLTFLKDPATLVL